MGGQKSRGRCLPPPKSQVGLINRSYDMWEN